jgi:hypothetical protein
MADPPDSASDPDAKALGEWTPADTVSLAAGGDIQAARDILRQFAEAVALTRQRDWPAQVPWPFVRYLAEAFRKILDEEADAGRALGVRRSGAGRPSGSRTHNEVVIAAAYWLLVRRGRAREEANAVLRDCTGADRRTIQRAAENCSAFEASDIDDDMLLAIASEQPSISKVLDRHDGDTAAH